MTQSLTLVAAVSMEGAAGERKATKAIECRYWRSGCCAKGDACPFGHGHGAVPDNTCRYFLRGQCAYGDRCRYSHVRPSSNARPRPQAQPVLSGRDLVPQPAASSPPTDAPSRTAGPYAAAASTLLGVGLPHEQEQEQEHPLMETNGSRSDPFAPEHQSDEWLEKKRVETERIQRSAGLECGICLEEVLNKPYLSDRRFAVMSHCEHIFCWRCMKDWRYGHGQMGGASSSAAEQARRCPECQQLSYFIAPCSFFPEGSEERAKVFEERRKQLSRIPCKHFDFGRGHCPFESSCFYAHIFPDGTREDGSRRKAGDAEGNIRVVQPVRLSSFLEASKHTAQN